MEKTQEPFASGTAPLDGDGDVEIALLVMTQQRGRVLSVMTAACLLIFAIGLWPLYESELHEQAMQGHQWVKGAVVFATLKGLLIFAGLLMTALAVVELLVMPQLLSSVSESHGVDRTQLKQEYRVWRKDGVRRVFRSVAS